MEQLVWKSFFLTSIKFWVCLVFKTHLMLIRYCARATDSALPVMVIVRSMLPPDSRSSQFEMRIMAPLSCLQHKNERKNTLNQYPQTYLAPTTYNLLKSVKKVKKKKCMMSLMNGPLSKDSMGKSKLKDRLIYPLYHITFLCWTLLRFLFFYPVRYRFFTGWCRCYIYQNYV